MECCQAGVSKAQFLEQKLKNFRAFLEPFIKTEDHRRRLEPYKDLNTVMPLLLQATAIRKASPETLDATLATMSEELQLGDEDANKLRRYMNMFCDVIIS